MTKSINIIRGNKNESYEDFHERIKLLISNIIKIGVEKLQYTISLEKPPGISVIPFSKEKIALISVTNKDDEYLSILQGDGGYSGTFRVTEALPIAYEKNWHDGEATPGVCLLTLFRQKKGIDSDTFKERWFHGHTPLTLKIHPIYHYNRNEVTESVGNPPVLYDGIVEEHCRTRKELLNPFKFFAKTGFSVVNMIKTYFDVKSFIDYKSIETYLVVEYHVIG